jgi:NTP pyrophosphatase (non-canonical NTP hydrolase)
MRWYDVNIAGRYEGKPREVNETVQARNEELAVKKAVAAELDRPDWSEIVWDFSDGGRMVITVQDDEDGYKTLKTKHTSLYDLVTEVTDGARLSRLAGAPELPGLSDGSAAEGNAASPRRLPSRFFRVTLRGETPDGYQVSHASTYRAWTHDGALVRAMEAALDVRPGDGRWVKGFAGPALSPRLKHGQLFLELIGPPGPKRGLTVKGSTLWDIVEEVSPPSWATPDAAPDAYQRQVLATWGAAGGSFTAQLLPAVLGLVGEAGEVADLIKKQLFKPGTVRDNAAVIDELADVAYYLAVLASLYGVTFDGLFAHLAGKLAGGHGWVNPSNSTGLEVGHE